MTDRPDTATSSGTGTRSWRDQFTEQLGALGPELGIPRATMRVQAWLMVSEPAEQTAPEIQDRLALSAGSVSTALRQLVAAGMLERVSRAGERRIFYRIASNSWDGPLQAKLRALGRMREVADRGISAAGDDVDFRLTEMRDAFAWFEHHLREHITHRTADRTAD